MTKTAVGATAPRPTIEELLEAIGNLTVKEFLLFKRRFEINDFGGSVPKHFHGEPGFDTHGAKHSHEGMALHEHPLENGW